MEKINTPQTLVKILILEDELFYNNLLKNKFQLLQQNPYIDGRYKLDIQQFHNPATFLQNVSNANNNLNTIVFIDYYLGYGITGLDIVYLLNEINKNIKIVLMSQSEKAIQNLNQPIWHNKRIVKMIKHEYTPEVCCSIVENYLKHI